VAPCVYEDYQSFSWVVDAVVAALPTSLTFKICCCIQVVKQLILLILLVGVHVMYLYVRSIPTLPAGYQQFVKALACVTPFCLLKIVTGVWPIRWPIVMYLSLVAVPSSMPALIIYVLHNIKPLADRLTENARYAVTYIVLPLFTVTVAPMCGLAWGCGLLNGECVARVWSFCRYGQ
jgi:hypothetical protein